MTSHQFLREFINERLTAAAGEIFTVFEQTVIQYEEEIDRQRRMLETSWEPQIKLHKTESRQQHVDDQKTSSGLEPEEHEAPHIKEEEDLVEVTVTDGESENSHDRVRDLTARRLAAAAVELFTLFEPTIVRYEEEIGRQRKLLETSCKPQMKLHNSELQQHRDCSEEQLFKQETNSCREPEELEPPEVKEEPEPLQIEEQQELQEGEQLILKVEIGSFQVPSSAEQSDLSEAEEEEEEEPDTEQLLSQNSDVHRVTKHADSQSTGNAAFASDKKKTCELCGKTYSRASVFSIHARSHTGARPFSCDACASSFRDRSSLSRHTRAHAGEKPHACETCGKSFGRQSTLLVHVRTHTGEKPYACETCGRSFCARSSFLRHKRTHTGEKPYPCETCGKSFGNNSNLVTHMRTHTGEKPYFCKTCGASFSQYGTLTNHMTTHASEKLFSCDGLANFQPIE